MKAMLRHVAWREGDEPVDLSVTERIVSAEFDHETGWWHIAIISEFSTKYE